MPSVPSVANGFAFQAYALPWFVTVAVAALMTSGSSGSPTGEAVFPVPHGFAVTEKHDLAHEDINRK